MDIAALCVPVWRVCSISIYVLGLTPLGLTPFILGTASGMAVWSTIYASIGGASKGLLQNGADLGVLLAGELGPLHGYPRKQYCSSREMKCHLIISCGVHVQTWRRLQVCTRKMPSSSAVWWPSWVVVWSWQTG